MRDLWVKKYLVCSSTTRLSQDLLFLLTEPDTLEGFKVQINWFSTNSKNAGITIFLPAAWWVQYKFTLLSRKRKSPQKSTVWRGRCSLVQCLFFCCLLFNFQKSLSREILKVMIKVTGLQSWLLLGCHSVLGHWIRFSGLKARYWYRLWG